MAGNKKNPSAQYAVIGLILAGLACVSTGLTGVAKGMVAQQIFTLDGTISDNINLAFNISLALIVIGLAAYAIMSPDKVRRFLTGRQAR